MKSTLFLALLITPALFADDAAVRKPLELYMKAHATGNGDYIRQAFLPEGRMVGMREGKLINVPIEQYASGFKGVAAEDEAQRRRRIVEVKVTGNLASAIVELDYPAVRFVDHFQLLETSGEWKIVNKAFYAEPKKK